MNKLIDGTLGQDNRSVILSIQDNQQELYNELKRDNPNYQENPYYKKTVSLKMYNRSWDFIIQTSKYFGEDVNTQRSIYILITGVIIDALLIFLFFVISGRDKKSLLLVDKLEKNPI